MAKGPVHIYAKKKKETLNLQHTIIIFLHSFQVRFCFQVSPRCPPHPALMISTKTNTMSCINDVTYFPVTSFSATHQYPQQVVYSNASWWACIWQCPFVIHLSKTHFNTKSKQDHCCWDMPQVPIWQLHCPFHMDIGHSAYPRVIGPNLLHRKWGKKNFNGGNSSMGEINIMVYIEHSMTQRIRGKWN